jgi:hypothetical protein
MIKTHVFFDLTDVQETAAKTNVELSKLADVGANNWVCHTTPDEDMLTKLYESPEFVRFGIFSGDLVLEHMIDSHGYTAMQGKIEQSVYDTCWWYSLCNFQYRQQFENTGSYNFEG